MNKELPSPLAKWHKTPAEMRRLWDVLASVVSNIQTGVTFKDLKQVTDEMPEIKKLVKTIERAQVAKAVAKLARKEKAA